MTTDLRYRLCGKQGSGYGTFGFGVSPDDAVLEGTQSKELRAMLAASTGDSPLTLWVEDSRNLAERPTVKEPQLWAL